MIIGLFISIYYSLHTLGIIDYIKRKKFLGTFIDVIIGLIFGLIFGCIIGIVIKPYIKNIIWIGLGILLLIYLALSWFVRNA